MLTSEEYRRFIYPLLDSARADRDEHANIQRGLSALDKVLKTRSTVHRAMYRQGLGWVDFVWGDEGKWPPTPSGERKGGKGISHAIEARTRKDGLGHGQAVDVLRRMARAIAEGEEIKRFSVGNAWTMTVFAQQ